MWVWGRVQINKYMGRWGRGWVQMWVWGRVQIDRYMGRQVLVKPVFYLESLEGNE